MSVPRRLCAIVTFWVDRGLHAMLVPCSSHALVHRPGAEVMSMCCVLYQCTNMKHTTTDSCACCLSHTSCRQCHLATTPIMNHLFAGMTGSCSC
jgi:hypothetical protein